MNRGELQRLANERISDVRVLLAARHWSAAYYLAGYVVEDALKACIAKLMKADLDIALRTDADLQDNWDCVKDWTESSRYARTAKAKAEQLFDAITDKRHGVLSWLKQRW